MALSFRLDGSDGRARATTVTLPHGSFHTPVFMPVGTKGSVKLSVELNRWILVVG